MKASNLTLTGSTQYDDLNGSNPSVGIIFDGITLYPSPYIVFTEKQYTKHYYIGSEKIATMIGDGGIVLETNYLSNEQRSLINDGFYRTFEPTAFQYDKTPNIDIQGMHTYQLEYECGCIEQVDLYLMSFNPMLEPMMTTWQNSNGCKNEIYYTHSNHLGSASWITDVKGNPIQYIHYAPYGELIANKQTIGYDERFKFTGKERDWETGYDYFGARFYDYRKGFWNSVDPLADKYPNVTPYLYCGGNPIKYVDPDGRESVVSPEIQKDSKYKLILQYAQYLDKINKEAIHFFGHGDLKRNRIALDVSNNIYINTPEELNQYLLANSETWVEYTATGNFTILVLESCNMGAGDDSFAQQMSAQYPNVLVVAANNNIEVINSQTAKVGSLVTLTNDTKVVKQSPQDAYIFFYNGERVNSMDPNTIPILTLKAQSKKYENQQHEND